MKSFAESLRSRAGTAEGTRPLLCAGNPLTCSVAIVGANPRTTTPFWKFWSDERGMDRAAWIAAYKAQHGGKFNRSRAAIERFIPQVKARVVELNAFSAQSERLANLDRSRRTPDVLRFVLEAVEPKVIICAGVNALRAVHAMDLSWFPGVVPAKHFIYWGKESERKLAAEVNRWLKSHDTSKHSPRI